MSLYSIDTNRTDFDHWSFLCAKVGAKRMVGKVYDAITSQYQNKRRAYHNLDHIAHCLKEFSWLKYLCKTPYAVELAIWYHDIIYDPRAKDNEENSGRRALIDLTVMGVDEVLAHDVKRLIILTKHDRTHSPTDIDGQVIVDVDLSILGQSPEVFDQYESAIREEYSWVPDEVFWPKREDFIMDMLTCDRIFYTDRCAERFGYSARKNLVRSIARKIHKTKEETNGRKN